MKLQYEHYVSRFILFVGLLVFVTSLVGVFRSYSPVPFWDQWDGYLGFYIRVMDGDWSAWWYQHNEHRIIFSRILFWLDLKYFGGKSYFLLASNIFLQFINALLLLYVAVNIHKANKSLYLVVIGSVLSLLFAWGQHENFTWGFQSQFIAVYTFSLSALICIVSIEKSRRKWVTLLFSAAAAVCASFSMANGLLIFPLLIVTALFVRLSWSNLLTIFSIGVITYTAYFWNYTSPAGHASVMDSLIHYPLEVIEYVCLYIGSPFYQLTGSLFVGKVFGVTLILLSTYFGLVYIKGERKNKHELVLLVFLLFIGGTALATASGRINFGLESASSSRYMTPAYLAWASLLILIVDSFKLNKKNTKLLVSILAILLMGFLSKQKLVFNDFSDMKFKRNMAVLSLDLEANDDFYQREVFPFQEALLRIASEAKKRKLSVFNKSQTPSKLTFDFDSKKQISCIGSHDQIIPVNNNFFRVTGWAYSPDVSAVPDRIILVNNNGTIVGQGIIGQSRPDVGLAVGDSARNSGWQSYIPSEVGEVTAYALYGKKSCRIPGELFSTSPLNFSFEIGITDGITTELEIIDDGGWLTEGIYPGSGKNVDLKKTLGSWVDGDIFTGIATFKLPSGIDFIKLSYITGPSNGGQFLKVLDATGKELKRLQLPTSDNKWTTLKIPVDLVEEGTFLQVLDLGTGWGEWSAYRVQATNNKS